MSEKAGCFRVSENFDTKALAERASREMSAMGYDVKLEKTEKGFRVAYEKDIGGMDTFLGRWQNSVAEIENSGGDLKVSFHGHRQHRPRARPFRRLSVSASARLTRMLRSCSTAVRCL